MHTQKTSTSPTAAAVILSLLLSGCGSESPDSGATSNTAHTNAEWTAPTAQPLGNFTEIDWDTLIPAQWRPEELFDELTDGEDVEEIADEDPRAVQLMDKLRDLWKQAPVVAALDGQRVKLPGFVVPIEFDLDALSEFLLVPYFGACIHVPPPPSNQIVHVLLPDDETYQAGVFDTVWVAGVIHVEHTSSDMANAGYRLEALAIGPYP